MNNPFCLSSGKHGQGNKQYLMTLCNKNTDVINAADLEIK